MFPTVLFYLSPRRTLPRPASPRFASPFPGVRWPTTTPLHSTPALLYCWPGLAGRGGAGQAGVALPGQTEP